MVRPFLSDPMKSKILRLIAPLFAGLAGLGGVLAFSALIWSHAHAADFTGPQQFRPNFKQARTEYSMVTWNDSDNREWLRVQGNSEAATVSEQWGPKSVSIESTKEPVVAKTLTGWIIVFK